MKRRKDNVGAALHIHMRVLLPVPISSRMGATACDEAWPRPVWRPPGALLPPRHPASPLLSQARRAADTDEGVERTHAKKAPLPLSLSHRDNDRLSSHSDQRCHPPRRRAPAHGRGSARSHTQRGPAAAKNPQQPRRH